MISGHIYAGRDLEAMSFATNYHRWILDEFRPFLGSRVVEVGSGRGDFSRMLMGEHPETLWLVEPSDLFAHLKKKLRKTPRPFEIALYNSTLREAASEIVGAGSPDTVVYVNVLEHVEADAAEIELVYQTLGPGGHFLIFVPAFEWLYGAFDRRVGHFRRYRKADLETRCRSVGFEIAYSRYFDVGGIAPWFVKFRLLGSDDLNPGDVRLYDRFAVPLLRRLEAALPVPVGKNILAVARKHS